MKFLMMLFATVFIAGCQQKQDAANPKATSPTVAPAAPTIAIDISTPDRALKSYWLAKDAYMSAEFSLSAAQVAERGELKNRIGFEPRKLMTSNVLAFHQEIDKQRWGQLDIYSREIVDIKQDTESRATAVATIRNSTPIPDGVVISDSDKKRRDAGEKLKYVLEKEADGWKVAQVYVGDRLRPLGEDWRQIFSAPDARPKSNIYVNEYAN